jgi:hypothetical protein
MRSVWALLLRSVGTCAVHIRSRWKLSDVRGYRYESERRIDVGLLIAAQTTIPAPLGPARQKRAEHIAMTHGFF